MEIEAKGIPDERNNTNTGPKEQRMLIYIMDWWLEHCCVEGSKTKAALGFFIHDYIQVFRLQTVRGRKPVQIFQACIQML